MPHYKSYPTVLTQPNRKARKALRKKIFAENKLAGNLLRRARKEGKVK